MMSIKNRSGQNVQNRDGGLPGPANSNWWYPVQATRLGIVRAVLHWAGFPAALPRAHSQSRRNHQV